MKKHLLSLAVLVLLIVSGYTVFAGNDGPFAGTVTYSIKIEGDMDPQEKAQQPTQMVMSYSNEKSRMEVVSPMGTTIIISNSETKETNILLDIMGNKVALKTTKEDYEKSKEEMPQVKITYSDETKDIAGYKCKKAEVSTDKNTTVYWYTDELNANDPNWSTPYSEIKGILMEYSMTQEEITITYTVTEVKKKKIKDLMFTVPVGYQQMSMEEFKTMMGG